MILIKAGHIIMITEKQKRDSESKILFSDDVLAYQLNLKYFFLNIPPSM